MFPGPGPVPVFLMGGGHMRGTCPSKVPGRASAADRATFDREALRWGLWEWGLWPKVGTVQEALDALALQTLRV